MQTAYGAEDITKLRARVTPEMLSYSMEDMNANASRGVVNRITNVKLLQGDPVEAWREGDTEYCTVAIRYSLTDEIVDRTSGKVTTVGPTRPPKCGPSCEPAAATGSSRRSSRPTDAATHTRCTKCDGRDFRPGHFLVSETADFESRLSPRGRGQRRHVGEFEWVRGLLRKQAP